MIVSAAASERNVSASNPNRDLTRLPAPVGRWPYLCEECRLVTASTCKVADHHMFFAMDRPMWVKVRVVK